MIQRLVLFLWLLGGLSCWSSQAEAKKKAAIKLVVLDFEEQGKIAPGAGRTLGMLLYSSINPQHYYMMDPNRLRPLLKRHQWSTQRVLSASFLSDLKKTGVRLILTGTVGHQYGTFSVSYRVVSITGRIVFSEVLPPVQSWVALVGSLQYSVKMLLKRSPSAKGQAARKVTKKARQAKKGKKKKKKKTALKEFATLVKGYKEVKGIFPLWIKEINGRRKIYMEVSPKQLNQIFLFSPTLEGGTGEASLITFAQLREFPFVLVRQDNQLLLMEKNVRFRIDPKHALSRVLDRSFTDSLHASTMVRSELHPKRKTFLVDFSPLFFKNLAGLSYYIQFGGRYYRRPLPFDKGHSRFGKIQNFPKNMELELRAFFRKPAVSIAVPPGYGMRIILRYSISALPSTGYRPRLADDRVGHFLMVAKDYTSDRVNTRYIRYISRWHLEKKNPSQAMSRPKQPIVFWLENAIPLRYRAAVAKGVLTWNKAFERIGFRDAIVVKQQPVKADWDPADVRYSTIRWFLANQAGFAQGPSRINPLTGQIYDADIRVSADMTMFLSQSFRWKVSPIRSIGIPGLQELFNPGRKMSILQSLERAINQFDQKVEMPHDHAGHQHTRFCSYGRGAMQQAALGWHLLQLRGTFPNEHQERKFIDDFLIGVIAHEVGHTLGLRHNFKASTLHSYKDLHDPKKTIPMGLTNSVMEYTPVNLALPGEKQGQYWQTTLGPYDHWAIEYAYKPIPEAKTMKQELPHLEKIASRVSNHKLAYATDEDAFGLLSPDPEALRWDLGRDPLTYYQTRTKLAQELWSRIEKKFGSPKFSYQIMRNVFGIGLGTYLRAGTQATKFIGGIYHRRDHIGDPKSRLPFQPVPAAEQRKALDFLIKNYFSPGVFKWHASLLNKLAPTRFWDFSISVWGMRVDYPIHRAAMVVQTIPLISIFHPIILDRIQDTRLRLQKGESYFSLTELFQKVSDAIWSELRSSASTQPVAAKDQAAGAQPPAKGKAAGTQPATAKTKANAGIEISSFRRNLQWNHMTVLGFYARVGISALADPSNLARLHLKQLQQRIEAALPKTKGLTHAHLERCLARIKLLLKPTLLTR